MEEISVWCDHLSFAALPFLVRTFIRHHRFSLRYTHAVAGGPFMFHVLKRVGLLKAESGFFRNTDHGENVDDPESDIFTIQHLKNVFSDLFVNAHFIALKEVRYPDPAVSPKRIYGNLRTIAATTTIELLEVVAFSRYWHRTNNIPTRQIIILSPRAVIANDVTSGWAGENVGFQFMWSWHHSLVLRVGLAFWQFMQEAFRLRKPTLSGPANVASTAHFHGLDPAVQVNDLHWWWGSGIPASRVILCFDQPNQSARRELVEKATALGIRCVVINKSGVGDSPHLQWTASPGPRVAVVRLWRKLKTCAPAMFHFSVKRWIACRVIDMLYTSERMQDFMREYNVKAFFHYQDSDSDYVSIACDAVQSARIGVQWSNIHWPSTCHVRIHQVYFAWGRNYANLIDAVDSCTDKTLLSGCLVQGSYPGYPINPEVQRVAQTLKKNGAERLLALFDTSIPCSVFYDFFLTRAISDPRWGILIKSKRPLVPPWVCQYDLKIKSLYERAKATGRVTMLNSTLSAAEAASVADVSVSAGINTAAVIAALSGHRAIHLDLVKLHESPLSKWAIFYRSGRDKVVFDDPEALWIAMNKYLDQPGSQPDFGLTDETLLQDIDPFRDGHANQRIGEYVRWYLEGVDGGLSRQASLDRATLLYAEKWGRDKIFHGLETESSQPAESGGPIRANTALFYGV